MDRVYRDSVKRFRSNATPLITCFPVTVNNRSENYTHGQSEPLMIWRLFKGMCVKYFSNIYLGARPSTLGRGWRPSPPASPSLGQFASRLGLVHPSAGHGPAVGRANHLRKLPKGTVPALCHCSSPMSLSHWTTACSRKVTLSVTSESRADRSRSVPFGGPTEGLIHVTARASEHSLGAAAAKHTAIHTSLSHFPGLDGTD